MSSSREEVPLSISKRTTVLLHDGRLAGWTTGLAPSRSALGRSSGSAEPPFEPDRCRSCRTACHAEALQEDGAVSRRGYRVRPATPVPPAEVPPRPASFVCAYATDVVAGDPRSSEDWARQVWEAAPGWLRCFMVLGWRRVLRLQLVPPQTPNQILGWTITERGPDRTVCQSHSSFMSAYNTFVSREGLFVWSTYIFYDRPIARLLWPAASLLHRPIVRLSLARARNVGPRPERHR